MSDNLDIKKFNKDMSKEVSMNNENDENEIGPEGDLRSEEMI